MKKALGRTVVAIIVAIAVLVLLMTIGFKIGKWGLSKLDNVIEILP